MARKKKDNTLLYLAGAGGAAYYFMSQQQDDIKIGGQTTASIFKKYGIVEGIDYIIDHVNTWPTSKSSPNYAKTKEKAILVAEKTVDLAVKSRAMLQKIVEKLDTLTWWGGAIPQISAIKNELYKISPLEKEIGRWIVILQEVLTDTPNLGVPILQDTIVSVLTTVQKAHKFAETYKSSWASKFIGAYESIGETLDDIWSAIKGVGRLAITLIKYAPYIVIGVGGLWAYNNFVKET